MTNANSFTIHSLPVNFFTENIQDISGTENLVLDKIITKLIECDNVATFMAKVGLDQHVMKTTQFTNSPNVRITAPWLPSIASKTSPPSDVPVVVLSVNEFSDKLLEDALLVSVQLDPVGATLE